MRSCLSMATACGLLRNSGLRIVKELRVPRLIVELDTLWGWVLKIRHILLEGNHCTNHLANLAQDDTDGLVYLNNPPNSISPFAADVLRHERIRF
ncbi:hypothetical protein Gohar_015816 [Gossypium harknessii]|uniref:Uncharacterized protein n=1 Tax=Gossypium harknessii TaxID=34285 RepID=A0A7J9G226_9ROSI|nr:hypothetical protein [Gossypium harknessii]